MIVLLDSLKDEFSQIEISDLDKNGKVYANTRWFYPKNKDRFHNVFIKVWVHPKVDSSELVDDVFDTEETAQDEFDLWLENWGAG